MGVSSFNARIMAENFDIEKYIECIEYAHLRGIKVYLTLNTLINTQDIKEALDIVIKLYSKGLDAVILQDIGLASLIHEIMPDLKLHASTQMSIYSLEQVKLMEDIGFSRVVLARELTLEEIEYICKNTNLEIEVFVHGALCVSMSGQCLLSSIIGKRSANRGNCAQTCRMKYSLYDKKGKAVCKDTYLLSKKDIYGLEYLEKLKKAGVYSFKIEGRNKNAEYVYAVTKIYNKYLNKKQDVQDSDKYVLKQIFNRDGQDTGYLSGVRYKETITLNSPKNTGICIGTVKEVYGKYVKLKVQNASIALHDGIEIYSKGDIISNIVTCIKDENGNITNKEANIGKYVWLGDIPKKVLVGSKIYKTSSSSLNLELKHKSIKNINRRKVDVNINILENKNITVDIFKYNIHIDFSYIPENSKTKELTEDEVKVQFSKTNDTAFEFITNVNLDTNLFVSTSKLNELRREVILKLTEYFRVNLNINDYYLKCNDVLKRKDNIINNLNVKSNNLTNTYYIYSYKQNIDYINEYTKRYNGKAQVLYINISDYIKYKEDIISKYFGKVQVYLYIQNYIGNNLSKIINDNLESYIKDGIDGILLGTTQFLKLCSALKKEYNIKLVIDYSFNITNDYSALFYLKYGVDVITPSVELEDEDILKLSKNFNIECVKNIITVMTSRYCILGSFVEKREQNKVCSKPCIKNSYYITDKNNAKYQIICDNIDCIMRIVKQRREDKLSYNIKRIRRCII